MPVSFPFSHVAIFLYGSAAVLLAFMKLSAYHNDDAGVKRYFCPRHHEMEVYINRNS